jgi:hypothetical protein
MWTRRNTQEAITMKQPTAPSTLYIRSGEACAMTGLTPKTLLRIATLNGVRVRKFPGMERGTMYHKIDLLKLLAAADRGANA